MLRGLLWMLSKLITIGLRDLLKLIRDWYYEEMRSEKVLRVSEDIMRLKERMKNTLKHIAKLDFSRRGLTCWITWYEMWRGLHL